MLSASYGTEDREIFSVVGGQAAVSYRITCNNGNQRTLINP